METVKTHDGRSLGEILQSHAEWIQDLASGVRCVLDGDTLNEVQLQNVNLQRAILRGTTLLDADLSGADLSRRKY